MTMYPTFKSSNAVITAVQFDGGLTAAGKILSMLGTLAGDVTKAYFVWKPDPADIVQGFRVATKTTGMSIIVMPLDWVCVLPGGVTAVISPHVFAASYEPHDEHASRRARRAGEHDEPAGDDVTGE